MRLTFIILLLNISINLFPVNISFAPLPNQQKLSSSSVISSKEDNDKYLWFATNDGLYRYDGYNVLPFKMNTQQNNPMRSNEITFLGGELDGKFWFGTTAGTYFIDKKNNYRITAPPFDNNTESATRYIYILSDKTILIATDHDMIVRYSAQGELIGSFNVNHSIDINCIIEDRKGNIFIAFWGRNISMFDKNSGEFTPLRKSSAINQCTTILQDPDYDYLWINSWGNGIVRFDPYAANVKDMFIIQNETVQNDGVLHDTHDIHNMVIDNHTGYIWTIGWKNAINIYERNPDGSLSRKDYIDNYAPGLNNIILNDSIRY